MQSSRPTHDVDAALRYKPSIEQLFQLPQEPDKEGIYFSMGDAKHSPTRVKINYHSPAVAQLVKEGCIGIDLYYPGYISSVNRFVPSNNIEGVPIVDIVRDADTVVMGNMEFKVANKPQLILMKRGKHSRDGKDFGDVINIIRNHYNTFDSMKELVGDMHRYLRRYEPDYQGDHKIYKLVTDISKMSIVPGLENSNDVSRLLREVKDKAA